MTHHQIPNEICIWKSQMIEFLDSRRKEVAIGVNQDNYDGALYYIRKDAFISKACKWIKEQDEMVGVSFKEDFLERFKDYIKGQ